MSSSKKFVLLTGNTSLEMQGAVNSYLEKGYKMQGGVSVSINQGFITYAVGMILEEKPLLG